MDIEEIMNIVMQYMPTVVAVVGIIATALKMISELKNSIKEVAKKNDQSELIELNKQLVTDNCSLKRQLKKLTEAITKIQEKEDGKNEGN